MKIISSIHGTLQITMTEKVMIVFLCLIFIFPIDLAFAHQNRIVAETRSEVQQPDTLANIQSNLEPIHVPERTPVIGSEVEEVADSIAVSDGVDLSNAEPVDSIAMDSITNVVTFDDMPAGFSERKIFNPDPSRAVWLSALLPGLGQIYNRRYWKIPIVIGGFMGLGYATSWNNGQLQDYTQAYRDLTDSDPATNSYMNFFPPNTSESDFDKSWLEATMKSRKDYYRRNRDLCIICLVGLYLLCMVDAYVDASLAHFDISDNLSLDLQPAMFMTPVDNKVALGLNWAFNF